MPTVDKSMMVIMGDLQHNMYEWCCVPPKEQRIFCVDISLPPDIELGSAGNCTTLNVMRGKYGGGYKNSS